MDGKLFINGIDLSAHVLDVKVDEVKLRNDWDAFLARMPKGKPITISGTWDDGTMVDCAGCAQPFKVSTEGPVGYMTVTNPATGERQRFGPFCDPCAAAFA